MKNITLTGQVCAWMISCVSLSIDVTGQDLPKPVAHYPLDVTIITRPPDLDKQWVIRPYDVSGNARHGIFKFNKPKTYREFPVQNSGTPNDYYIQKTDADNTVLEIPDPFDGYDFSQGFTLTFWIYWDGVNDDDILLTIPKMSLSCDDAAIKVTLKTNSAPITRESAALGDPGWYFMAMSATDSGSIDFYKYSLTSTYDPDVSGLANNSDSFTGTPQSFLDKSQLLDQQFSGTIANVRFFDTALSDTAVNEYRNADYFWAQKDFTYPNYKNFNYETGTYSQYLLDTDSTGVENIKRHGDGELDGSVQGVTQRANRFSESGKAAQLSSSGNIDLTGTKFSDLQDYLNNYNGKDGMSIAFWTYISSPQEHNKDGNYPFAPDTDLRFSIFYGSDSNNKFNFGMERVKDILGMWRVARNQPDKNWFLWFYKPANLPSVGWYHVVLIYEPKIMKTIVIPYNDPPQIDGRFNYFGIEDQDASWVKHFGFGKPVSDQSQNRNAIEVLDDVRIYNWPLTMKDVEALNYFESMPDPGTMGARLRTSGTAMEVSSEEISQDSAYADFSVYPNPASSNLVIDLGNDIRGVVLMSIKDLSGKTLYEDYVEADAGVIHISDIKTITPSAGLYILKVVHKNRLRVRKLIVN